MDSIQLFDRLARALPDIPRWVETRALLLAGRCEILGLQETRDLAFVLSSTHSDLVTVVGRPERETICEAVAKHGVDAEVLTTPENRHHVSIALPDWRAVSAAIHVLGDALRRPRLAPETVRFLEYDEIASATHIPAELKAELAETARYAPIAATFVQGLPVSFCCVAWETESWWDVSIDTLAGYRNRGYAGQCVAFTIDHMRSQGKRPVWGAEEDNLASQRLAAKLGFVRIDELVVFHAG